MEVQSLNPNTSSAGSRNGPRVKMGGEGWFLPQVLFKKCVYGFERQTKIDLPFAVSLLRCPSWLELSQAEADKEVPLRVERTH